jgi:recombination protein RecR
MSTDPVAQLVSHLSRLPGIGEKTAVRLAFHLIRGPKANVRELAAALIAVVDKIRLCSVCANVTEADPCGLCADPGRDAHLVCVVAGPSDVVAIERGAHYRGRYHVLHGLLSPLEGVGPEDLRIDALLRRLAPAEPGGPAAAAEVILATSANVEGEATAMYLARLLKPLGVKVTRIASGIPVGGELEYSDQATIARALDGRALM